MKSIIPLLISLILFSCNSENEKKLNLEFFSDTFPNANIKTKWIYKYDSEIEAKNQLVLTIEKTNIKNEDDYKNIAINFYKYNNWIENEDIELVIDDIERNFEANIPLDELMSIVAHSLKNKDTAITYYKKAIKINPLKATHHSNLGWCLTKIGDYKNAEKSYKKAIKIDSSDYFSNINYSELMLKMNKPDIAIYHAANALENSDGVSKRHLAIGYKYQGQGYNEMGDYKKALKNYDIALNKRPEYTSVLLQKGKLLLKLESTEKGCDCFKKAIDLKDITAKKLFNENCK